MAFRSPTGEQIAQALKASKARWNLAKEADKKNRSFQPSDVPGTLLNMALLNLSQQRATLRAAACVHRLTLLFCVASVVLVRVCM